MGKQYELYVQKGQPFWKVLTNILFSHVGLFVLVIGYCIGGDPKLSMLTSIVHNHFKEPLCFKRLKKKERRKLTLQKYLQLRFKQCLCILVLQRESESLPPTVNFMEHSPNENDNGYA